MEIRFNRADVYIAPNTRTEQPMLQLTVPSVPIPLELFIGGGFSGGSDFNPRLCPNRQILAYRGPSNRGLFIRNLTNNQNRTITGINSPIDDLFWSEDGRYLFYFHAPDPAQPENTQLFRYDTNTNKTINLTPRTRLSPFFYSTHRNRPNEVLIFSEREEGTHIRTSLCRLNLNTRELQVIPNMPRNMVNYVIDNQGSIRGAFCRGSNGERILMVRQNESSQWTEIARWDNTQIRGEDDWSSPVHFSRDGKFIYMQDSRNSNTARFVEIEIATGRIRCLAENPTYDVGSEILRDPNTSRVQAVGYHGQRFQWIILDESIRKDFNRIQALHTDSDFHIVSQSNDNNTWIVRFTSGNKPTTFYSFNRRTGQSTVLFSENPQLASQRLGTVTPIRFRSSDGLDINGYLTLPPGLTMNNTRKLPLVIYAAGGPTGRASYEFNSQDQFLASRGYAVLTINNRGRNGYGKNFFIAGHQEWGRNVIRDFAEAAQWALFQQIADPRRITIYGHSFGGHTALQAAALYPNLFTNVIASCGPYDLITMIRENALDYGGRELTTIGNPENERRLLEQQSPAYNLNRIRARVLLVHGEEDTTVPLSQTQRIYSGLRRHGINVRLLTFPGEGHIINNPANLRIFYNAIENFLRKN